ncbi:MAG: acyl dehydratase [Acidimicrobiales bacterium]|jgi:acyl dehydratase|nr:MAG: acyl dehydratase [Acidimicrobiales bacterium]
MASLRFDQVTVGDQLAPLDVPLTHTLIVATAIASRDYQEVHHDADLARERGSKDIIMNILTTNGFIGRFVTDWAGPDATIRSVKVRLGVPNYPGDTMALTGEVTELRAQGNVAVVAVRGANSLGDHVNATIEVSLP